MFNGKIHYKWRFSIAMLNNQRVSTSSFPNSKLEFWNLRVWFALLTFPKQPLKLLFFSIVTFPGAEPFRGLESKGICPPSKVCFLFLSKPCSLQSLLLSWPPTLHGHGQLVAKLTFSPWKLTFFEFELETWWPHPYSVCAKLGHPDSIAQIAQIILEWDTWNVGVSMGISWYLSFQVSISISWEIHGNPRISPGMFHVKPNLLVRLRNTKTLCAELLRGVGGLLLDRTALPIFFSGLEKSGQGYGLYMGYRWLVNK